MRFDQHHPPIELDLGTLKESAYAVRMIAATDSEKIQQSTKRLVVHFEVNDGVEGEVNAYKKRCAANDQFYSMAEFFFMAPVERAYKVKLQQNRVRIYVRRGGPNYQEGLAQMRRLGEELGVPVEVFGPETHMTRIVTMSLAQEEV